MNKSWLAILTGILLGFDIIGTPLAIFAIHKVEVNAASRRVVCLEHRALARIAKEENEEAQASNRKLLPRINITGISHAELVRSTLVKEAAKQKHAAELERIRMETC